MANEAFWTAAGSYDAAEMRRYNATFYDNATPGGVVSGLALRIVSTQVVVDQGAAVIADGASGLYLVRNASSTAGITPPTTPGTYIVYMQEQDPGTGGTAGEPTYGIASSLPGSLAIPLGTFTASSGGGQAVSYAVGAGGRRVAKLGGVSDGGNAAFLNGQIASQLSVATAVNATKLSNKLESQLNVSTAVSCTNAQNAAALFNDSAYMRFHWSGQSGQPTWLWGGNAASDMYVYNPANFNVNHAQFATLADFATNAEQANKAYNADHATTAGSVPNATVAVGFSGSVAPAASAWESNGAYTYYHPTPLRVPNMLIAAGAADVRWGSGSGALVRASSSRRYKKDIIDLPVSVAALRGIRPVEFEYDNSVEGVQDDFGRQGGFIAEEVEEHFPDAVHHNADGEVENVHDRALLAGAYKLIADLYEKVEALEARLAEQA